MILNGNGEIQSETVQKVLAAKEKVSYQPDYFARQMITKETKTIGVLVPDITNPFFSTLMRGIEDILYKQNFVTILCNADSDHQKEIEYLAELTSRCGWIHYRDFCCLYRCNQRKFEKQGRPFIVLDQKNLKDLVMPYEQTIFAVVT